MKKIVHFCGVVGEIVVGHSALVYPIDHPDQDNVSNTRLAKTSRVVAAFEDGSFETQNTFYKPRKN